MDGNAAVLILCIGYILGMITATMIMLIIEDLENRKDK